MSSRFSSNSEAKEMFHWYYLHSCILNMLPIEKGLLSTKNKPRINIYNTFIFAILSSPYLIFNLVKIQIVSELYLVQPIFMN